MPAPEPPTADPTDPALHCPTCGYNLTGLPQNRCPECGQDFEHDRLLLAASDKPPPLSMIGWMWCLLTVPTLSGIIFYHPTDTTGHFFLVCFLAPAVLAITLVNSTVFAGRMTDSLSDPTRRQGYRSRMLRSGLWVAMFLWQLTSAVVVAVLML